MLWLFSNLYFSSTVYFNGTLSQFYEDYLTK